MMNLSHSFTRLSLAVCFPLAFTACDANKSAYESWREKNGGDLNEYLTERMDRDLTHTRLRARDQTNGVEPYDQTVLSHMRQQAYRVTRGLALSQKFNKVHDVDRLMRDGETLAQTMFKSRATITVENAAPDKNFDYIMRSDDVIIIPPRTSYENAFGVIQSITKDAKKGDHFKIRLSAPRN